ncbi:MAG: hypothetical protein ICV62_12010 [Cyanobacteria bacterium Co-bin13]|nr:hypothetical protein [Cyanobacteria bacterium Co-bin13]
MASPTLSYRPSTSRGSTRPGDTRLRLRLAAAEQVSITRALDELKTCCGVVLQAVPVRSPRGSQLSTYAVELDLKGPLTGIQQALCRLQALPITIQGRANPDGDSWYC